MLNNKHSLLTWVVRVLCVVMFLLVLSGCRITVDAEPSPNPNPVPVNPIEQLYKQNLRKWQLQNFESYDFVFQRICFCPREITRPARAVVQDDKITGLRWIETYEELSADKQNIFLTIDAIFDLIKSAIDKDAATIQVDYDASFGYPTKLFIDYDEAIADEELNIQASFLKTAPNGVEPIPSSCEPYSTNSYEYGIASNSDKQFATLQVFSESSGTAKVCVRSQHTNGCIEAVEVSSSFEKGMFKLTKQIVPIQTFIACAAAITPYARLVEVDVVGLEPGTYPINYHVSENDTNPRIQTSIELKSTSN